MRPSRMRRGKCRGRPSGTAAWLPLSRGSAARKWSSYARRTRSKAPTVAPQHRTLSGGRGGGVHRPGHHRRRRPAAGGHLPWTGRPRQWLPLQRSHPFDSPPPCAAVDWGQRPWQPPLPLPLRRSSPRQQLRHAPTTRRRRGESGTTRHSPRYKRHCRRRPRRSWWRCACAHSWHRPASCCDRDGGGGMGVAKRTRGKRGGTVTAVGVADWGKRQRKNGRRGMNRQRARGRHDNVRDGIALTPCQASEVS